MTFTRTAKRTDSHEPAARAPLPEDVYRHLRQLIVHGRLTPGSRLVEAPLAAALGVSRTPVRSALQRLQQEGYVLAGSILSPSGAVVAPLTRDDAMEVFLILASLESRAAERATAWDSPARAALADRLQRVNDELLRASDPRSPDHLRLHDLHAEFHRVLVDAAAGPRLRSLHDVTNAQAERYERIYSSYVSETERSVREHEAIIAAIRTGSSSDARDAVEGNWRNSAERLARVIDRAGEFGRWSPVAGDLAIPPDPRVS